MTAAIVEGQPATGLRRVPALVVWGITLLDVALLLGALPLQQDSPIAALCARAVFTLPGSIRHDGALVATRQPRKWRGLDPLGRGPASGLNLSAGYGAFVSEGAGTYPARRDLLAHPVVVQPRVRPGLVHPPALPGWPAAVAPMVAGRGAPCRPGRPPGHPRPPASRSSSPRLPTQPHRHSCPCSVPGRRGFDWIARPLRLRATRACRGCCPLPASVRPSSDCSSSG